MTNAGRRQVGVVHADYHTFWIRNRESPMPWGGGAYENGLVSEIQPGSIIIKTGISSGNVTVGVDLRLEPENPEAISPDWDEVIELTVGSTGAELLLTSLFVTLPVELPSLATDGAGLYRPRVCAHGRDTAVDMAKSDVETYGITSWPVAEREPPRIVRQTDGYGRSLRNAPTA